MKVSSIDWTLWQPDIVATLMFVIEDSRVLLIRKKRGLGAGNINGPGGKLDPGETPEQCAVRETQEELCITPTQVRYGGELFFHAEDEMPKIHGFVYVATGYRGTPTETDEAIPIWTPLDRIPFEEMWQDDQFWLPQVLAGQVVKGWFSFEGEQLLDYKVDFS
ncbi:MAG: 8-oxo-dGTP diphosphatase [Pseudomonadales bacterium]|jgi:8-oxo-dGTP diphosphatase|nr:8-oxo-dGTP diphosphatase [Pseudomonadales bacterium]MDG1444053.1 8-oxo-dGTP diphosphatase [Pseudomonadales bacterium]